MVEINLLPWRQRKKQYERYMSRYFMLAGVVAAFLLLTGAHVYLKQNVDRHAVKLASLDEAMHENDASSALTFVSLKDKHELTLLDVIHLLNAASLSVASGVCYQKIEKTQKHTSLTGRAWSPIAMTAGLRQLQGSTPLLRLKLHEVKKDAAMEWVQFILNAEGG